MSNQLIQSGLIFFKKKKPTQARAEGKPISGAEYFTNRGLSLTKLSNEMLITR
jgi:hypothetical protein